MVLTAVIAVLLLTATMVAASHQFTDVPNSSQYHGDITWAKDHGVTGGCSATKYCPKNYVTREQMATFLHNTANVVAPNVIALGGSLADVDLDAEPVVCQTASYSPPYAQVAVLNGTASLEPDVVPLDWYIHMVYQVDGGLWTDTSPATNGVTSTTAVDRDSFTSHNGTVALAKGSNYKFGIQMHDWDGTSSGDATLEGDGTPVIFGIGDPATWCSIVVQIGYRNA
jgi:hypothetical protein